MMHGRKSAGMLLLALFSALLLPSCWDKTELNELALVSMIGVDHDPETNNYTVYYQIVNPQSGSSARVAPGGEQAPVYTYTVSGSSLAEIHVKVYKILPRTLFLDHSKTLLISARAAKHGIKEIVNFIEMMPDTRAAAPVLVVDGPFNHGMRTFTPLDRIPANSIDARINILRDRAHLVGESVELRTVIERSLNSEMVVLPILKVPSAKPVNSWERSADISANRGQFKITGGAVMRDFRMVGRLNDDELLWYNLIEGIKGHYVRHFAVNGRHFSAEMNLVRSNRDVSWNAGRAAVRIKIELHLSTGMADDYIPQNIREMVELEQQLSEIIADEMLAFYRKTRERGWDLFRIRSLLYRKSPHHPDLDRAADDAVLDVQVNTRLTRMGNMNRLFGETE